MQKIYSVRLLIEFGKKFDSFSTTVKMTKNLTVENEGYRKFNAFTFILTEHVAIK